MGRASPAAISALGDGKLKRRVERRWTPTRRKAGDPYLRFMDGESLGMTVF